MIFTNLKINKVDIFNIIVFKSIRMMRFIKNLLLLLPVFGFCCNTFSQTDSNKKIIIIRHGEKADEGGNLSCQGLNRALGLSAVLYAKYKLPNHIFVPAIKNGKSTNQS